MQLVTIATHPECLMSISAGKLPAQRRRYVQFAELSTENTVITYSEPNGFTEAYVIGMSALAEARRTKLTTPLAIGLKRTVIAHEHVNADIL